MEFHLYIYIASINKNKGRVRLSLQSKTIQYQEVLYKIFELIFIKNIFLKIQIKVYYSLIFLEYFLQIISE